MGWRFADSKGVLSMGTSFALGGKESSTIVGLCGVRRLGEWGEAEAGFLVDVGEVVGGDLGEVAGFAAGPTDGDLGGDGGAEAEVEA